MRIKLASLFLFAITSVMAAGLAAQCPGGGCGASTGGSTSGGCSGGSCPSGGCGSGGTGSAPAAKGLGRGPSQPTGAGRAGRAAPAPIDPAGVPAFELPSSSAMDKAASEQRPLIIYFPGENADDSAFYGEELANFSKSSALFVKVPYTADREKSPWAEASVVPTSPLLSDNPSRDYGVKVGVATVIVADWFGNEYFRTDNKATIDSLRGMVRKVADKMDAENKKLQKNLDKAVQANEKADRKTALKHLLANFKDGKVGLEAQEASIRLYHEIMDAARAEIDAMVSAGNKDGLKGMAKDLKGTDAEKAAQEALKGMN